METKHITPLKAIRLKCLDCCCGSAHEVKLCTTEKCPLYLFRLGKNPNRAGIGGSGHFEGKQKHSTSDSAVSALPEGTYIPQEKNGDAQIKAGGIADG